MTQTLEQRRAAHAWSRVEALMQEPEDAADAYAREAKKMPVRVLTAGLGQALAFINRKANQEGLMRLSMDLTHWVVNERRLPTMHQNSLVESVVHGDATFLRRATDEALAYLVWLNRFLEAKGLPRKRDD